MAWIFKFTKSLWNSDIQRSLFSPFSNEYSVIL